MMMIPLCCCRCCHHYEISKESLLNTIVNIEMTCLLFLHVDENTNAGSYSFLDNVFSVVVVAVLWSIGREILVSMVTSFVLDEHIQFG